MAHAPTVLIMGPPGAGKGTQASHLVERYGLRHVATGDLLRTAVREGTELGREAKRYMDSGDLVPDDVIIGMLRELVAGLGEGDGVLLDGFPRTRPQAVALDDMLADLGRDVSVVLDIRVPSEVLVDRLSSRWICRECQTPYNVRTNPPKVEGRCDRCGGELYQRDDDRPEAVRTRLEVYEEQTAPVAEHYREQGTLVEIDGDQPMDDVQRDLDTAMERVDASQRG